MAEAPIEIKLRITENGIEIFDQAGKKVEDFGKKAEKANEGGLRDLTKGMADIKATWDSASGTFGTIAQIALDLNAAGVAGMRVAAGFEAMGGQESTIKRMMEATRSLVDDEVLMSEATTLMSSKILSSADDMEEFARIGATLGIVFKGNATAGVNVFADALQGVGNVRTLRQLGVDAVAVRDRFEELQKKFSDSDAWRMAVLEVAGKNADKLSGALESTGTGFERLQTKIEMSKGAIEEWVANGVESAVTALEGLEGIWNKLQTNPNLTLTLTMNAVNSEATNSLNQTNDALTTWLNNASTNLFSGPAAKNTVIPLTSPMEQEPDLYGPPKALAPNSGSRYRNAALHMLDAAGKQQNEDEYRASIGGDYAYQLRRNKGYNPDIGNVGMIGGDEAYWARRNGTRLPALEKAQGEGLGFGSGQTKVGDEYTNMLRVARDFWGDISNIAGDYNTKLQGALAPLQEQQRLLEKRRAIQSIDDAFGVGPADGLYSEIGGGMEEAVAKRREQEELRLARRYGRNSKKYKTGMEKFDDSTDEALDDYAVATGAATRESLKFREITENVNAAFADGKLSAAEYAAQMLALGGAAKSGVTSLEDLDRILGRIGLRTALDQGLSSGKLKGPQKGAATRYLATTKGTDGENAQGDGGMFSDLIAASEKASSAVGQVGTAGAQAIAGITVAGAAAVSQIGELTTQGGGAIDVFKRLEMQLNKLASLSITVTATQAASGTGGSRGVGGVSSPR